MEYFNTIQLKNGKECILKTACAADAAAVLDVFNITHAQTDYLLSYPEEITYTIEEQEQYLQSKADSANAVELAAIVEGKVVGLAGIDPVGEHYKTRHRADFGISVLREYWGLGIGRALTKACIACAEQAGYKQLELEVVAANQAAVALYCSEGFTQFGSNPRGFRSRHSGWQELVLMRKELP